VSYSASVGQSAGTDYLTNVGVIGDTAYDDIFDLRGLETPQLGYITDPKNVASLNTILLGRGGSDTIYGNGQTWLNFSAVNGSNGSYGRGLIIDLTLGTANASNLKNGTVTLGTEHFSGVSGVVGT